MALPRVYFNLKKRREQGWDLHWFDASRQIPDGGGVDWGCLAGVSCVWPAPHANPLQPVRMV
jgi:hypothetical protein